MRRSFLPSIILLALLSFGYRSGTSIDSISKIYLTGSTLIRTTPNTNIKFYDLANPRNPIERGTIDMTGNSDVAVMGHYMYADHDRDLVIFDIADIDNPKGIDTIKGAFTTPYSFRVWNEGTTTTQTHNPNNSLLGSGCSGCRSDDVTDAPTPMALSGGTADGSGTAGATARFAIAGNYLYCIDDYTLRVFDISDAARPRYKNAVEIGWQIETIFPYNDKLFIGGTSGMYICDIADADNPTLMGEFQHPRRCDPVVVDGNTAYVTLRSGGACGGNDNQMDILDVSDLRHPRLVSTALMSEPYGLAVRNGIAVVCDGSHGLTIVDATDRANPKKIGAIDGIIAHDIIIEGNLMIVTGSDGFSIFDASDIRKPTRCGRLDF